MVFPLAATSPNILQANSSTETSTAEQVLLGHYTPTAMPNTVVMSPLHVPSTTMNDDDGSTSAQLGTQQPTQGQHVAQVFDAAQNIAPCPHVKLVATHTDPRSTSINALGLATHESMATTPPRSATHVSEPQPEPCPVASPSMLPGISSPSLRQRLHRTSPQAKPMLNL
ncbi:hypothetical protein AAC387_Pa12g2126 [Persea americana]